VTLTTDPHMTVHLRHQRTTPARQLAIALARVLLLIGVAMTFVGCGSNTISESDMARYALRNKPEVEETEEPPAAAAKAPVQTERVASREPSPVKSSAVAKKSSAASTVPNDTSPSTDEPSSEPLTDTESPPAKPLSPDERTKRTVANLERIAAAFQKHLDAKGYYPARSISNGSEEFLSWRVALLPYLGYQQLYDQFRLDEPWNSRHNYELLQKIPAVYQSPERFDDHTNYAVAVESSTMYRGLGVVRPTDVEDGPKNTVMLVETDDVAAVPWTAPREFAPDAHAPGKNLGSLRGGSIFLIWGNAEVGRVLASAPATQLRAMFTHDAGEDFSGGKLDQPLFASATPAPRATLSSATATSTGSTSVAATAPSVVVESSALASDYAQQSSEALERSDEQLGISYYYAAALAGPPGRDWVGQFKWVPALRRPTPVYRIALGLQYEGPQQDKLVVNARNNSQSRAWTDITGDLGGQLVEVVASHVAAHGNSALHSQNPQLIKRSASAKQRGTGRMLDPCGLFAPGIAYLPPARESALRKLAQLQGIDLLLLVDWRETARGWSAGLSLIDVVRGAEVWKAPRIVSAKVDRARANPLITNPIDETLRELAGYLESQCIFQPIPEQLQRRHAAARIATLARQQNSDSLRDSSSLRDLVEMRLYQELGLVDATELVKAYQAKLGTDPGLALVLGSDNAKRTIFKSLLPAVPLIADRNAAANLRSNDEEE
jgi:hypothetical protein